MNLAEARPLLEKDAFSIAEASPLLEKDAFSFSDLASKFRTLPGMFRRPTAPTLPQGHFPSSLPTMPMSAVAPKTQSMGAHGASGTLPQMPATGSMHAGGTPAPALSPQMPTYQRSPNLNASSPMYSAPRTPQVSSTLGSMLMASPQGDRLRRDPMVKRLDQHGLNALAHQFATSGTPINLYTVRKHLASPEYAAQLQRMKTGSYRGDPRVMLKLSAILETLAGYGMAFTS